MGGYDRDRPPRVELPVPDQPPYNAFVGNLSFEVTSSDLELLFGDKVRRSPSTIPIGSTS